MNRLAVHYAFDCSHIDEHGVECIDTFAVAFLLAIAYRIPSRSRYETEPTTLREFAEMTRMCDRKLREMRSDLVKYGILRQGGPDVDHETVSPDRWAKRAIYRLIGLAGPLFIVPRWDVDRDSAHGAAFGSPNSASGAAFRRTSRHAVPNYASEKRHRMPRELGTSCRVGDLAAGGVLSSSGSIRTNDHHDDADLPPIVSAGAQVVAADLVEWVRAEYPKHNGDALFSVSQPRAIDILGRLIATGRTVDKVKAMVLKLWTCTERDRGCRWIATTDRSLQVLWEARDTLDQLVSRTTPHVAPEHPVRDSAAQRQDDIGRCIRALERRSDTGLLAAACVRAIDALRAGEFEGAALDELLFDAARGVVDVAEAERLAAESLAQYRPRISTQQYERALAIAVRQQVREMAGLPTISAIESESASADTVNSSEHRMGVAS